MIGYLRAFVRILMVIYFTIYYVSKALILERVKSIQRERVHQLMALWAQSILKALGVEIHGELPEIPAGVLLLPNHRSYVDILLVQALSPSSIVAKKEVGKWPLIRSAVRICEIILIDRSSGRSRLAIAGEIKDKTRNGQSVIMFPEGTTALGPELKPLKKGTFKIAAEEKICVLPLAYEYKYQDMAWIGDDTFFRHFFDVFRRKKNPVRFQFGEAIFKTNSAELIEVYENWINKTTLELRSKWDSN